MSFYRNRFFASLRYRWYLLLLGLLLAGSAGYVLSFLQPPRYAGVAQVLVVQTGQTLTIGEDSAAAEHLLSTYAELAESYPVLVGAIAQAQLPLTPEALAKQVRARPLPDTSLLELRAVGDSPEQAAAIANALAEQLIHYNPAGPESESARALKELQTQSGVLAERIQKLEGEVLQLDLEAGTTQNQVRQQDLRRQQSDLEQRLEELRWQKTLAGVYATSLSTRTTSLTLVDPARPDGTPVEPRPILNGLQASLGGLLLAALLALGIERRNTIAHPDDIAATIPRPLLGTIPKLPSLVDERSRLVISQDPHSLAAESYRSVAVNLHFFNLGDQSRAFVVAGTAPGEGTTTVAANLAVALSLSGTRVILVDANLYKPTLHRIFELDNSFGLTTMLTEGELDSESRRAIAEVSPGLSVIPSGPPLSEAHDLIDSDRMELLLWVLQAEADIVIFDAPPLLLADDTVALARRCHSAVLVVENGRTRRSALRHAAKVLEQAEATIVGVVLNKVDARRDDYYNAKLRRTERRRQQAATPARVTALVGAYLLLYGGGHYADMSYELMAARGDNHLQPVAVVSMPPSALNTFVVDQRPAPERPFVVPRLNEGSGRPAAQPAVETPAVPKDLTRLIIPKIGLDSKVMEVGQEIVEDRGREVAIWQVAKYTVGHHNNSAYPGDGENIVLAGHVAGAAHVFRDLIMLEPGDQLTLYSLGRQYLYVVAERTLVQEVGVSDEQRMENARYIEPAGEELVTLITCWPPQGPQAFSQRVVVRARPYGAATTSTELAPDSSWILR